MEVHENAEGHNTFAADQTIPLIQDVDIVRLEGLIFSFNPRATKQDSLESFIGQIGDTKVVVTPHQKFGRPTIGTYRTQNALFAKLSEGGWPYPDTVTFSAREIEHLRGNSSGTWQARRTYNDLMQLQSTTIECVRKIQKAGKGRRALIERKGFSILNNVLTESEDDRILNASVTFNSEVIEAMNTHHFARFNWQRLRTFEPIGIALAKRYFQWGAMMLYKQSATRVPKLRKDYSAVCNEWLGGITAYAFQSKVVEKLKPHFNELEAANFARLSVEKKRGRGKGFNITCELLDGFYEDYDALYKNGAQNLPRLTRDRSEEDTANALKAVEYFHMRFGRPTTKSFSNREVHIARDLLRMHSYEEIEDFVDYAVIEAAKTNFHPQHFQAIGQYRARWQDDPNSAEKKARREHNKGINDCAICDDNGYIRTDRNTVMPCPHDAAEILKNEQDQKHHLPPS